MSGFPNETRLTLAAATITIVSRTFPARSGEKSRTETVIASIRPHNGKYRAEVELLGVRRSKVCRLKSEANAWAAAEERKIRENAGKTPAERHTLRDAFKLYKETVTVTKGGATSEGHRIDRMMEEKVDGELLLPMDLAIGDVTTSHMDHWCRERLKKVSAGAVLRDINIISNIFTVARKQWKWVKASPVTDMWRPPEPRDRKVIYTWQQLRGMLTRMGYRPLGKPQTPAQALALAWLFACRTGAREGECAALRWTEVRQHDFHVDSKTEAGNRDVPLLHNSRRLLEKMRGFDPVYVFGGTNAAAMSQLFTQYRGKAGFGSDKATAQFTFHDSRHYAATAWCHRVEAIELCVIFGWSDPKEALTYYQPKASVIAKRLAAQSRSGRSGSGRSD